MHEVGGAMNRFGAKTRSQAVLMAVVLGTAAATGAGKARAAVAGPNPKAVQDISKYCQACWRNARLPADRWPDCTQDVFARLLERVEPDKWAAVLRDDETAERREFIRAVDAAKKRVQRTRKFAALTPDVADHARAENVGRDDREAVAKAAAEVLSPRQRRVLELTADGWATPEIAAELNTTVERVSDEKYKAVRKLRHYFGTA